MQASNSKPSTDRRRFLKFLGTSAVTGAAAVTAAASGADAAEQATNGSGQYAETEHIRTYYELAKF